MQEAFVGIFRNLPFRPLAWIVRLLTFPTGLPYHKPSDRLDHAVAGAILQPGEARARLTAGIFLSSDLHEPVARLDQALAAAVASSPIEKTLRQARRAGQIHPGTNEVMVAEAVEIGILTESDAQLVLETQRLRDQVIQVDAFDDLSSRNKEKSQQGETSIRHLGAA
ncbi:acyl-CoA dehydrogenase domain-containing protein [endosymbiont of Lamellibrachia barhami]|uniref:acyl-CoA dehydrogenase domain-containing protein n=1 Tax=endosymbiont of Lamellibrachia barhami TaxID=205975 RepID=UPI0015AD9B66|nr:acyl-CoA dehydrogenase domain-containing protein [endosymbiont of Lamellibrachia barhami]